MPKITLHNTESGQDENFEPVDAREILSNPDTIYEVAPETAKMLGLKMDANATAGLNIPQLQSGDEEMQTGNSIDKYARQQVVKAIPGNARDPNVVEGEEGQPGTRRGRPVAAKKKAAKADDDK